MRNCPNAKTPAESEAKGTEDVAKSLGSRGSGREAGGPRWWEGSTLGPSGGKGWKPAAQRGPGVK